MDCFFDVQHLGTQKYLTCHAMWLVTIDRYVNVSAANET